MMTRKVTASKSPMPANSPFLACVPPGENRLTTARSCDLPTTDLEGSRPIAQRRQDFGDTRSYR